MRISTFLGALFLLGIIAIATADLECYYCSFTYTDASSVDSQNCVSPGYGTTNGTCTGNCSTTITINTNSMTLTRSCEVNPIRDCKTCDNPEDCEVCCDNTDLCNNNGFYSLLSAYGLTQTCYNCRYSEIPGVHSDAGCGLDFDSTSSEVETMHCPGMCYSGVSYIPGVEDVRRGCSYYGNDCDKHKNPYITDKSQILRNSVSYKTHCCTGENCNGACAVTAGFLAIAIVAVLTMVLHS